MKQVSFEEIGGVVATFQRGEDVSCGAVVAMSGNGTVAGCDDGDVFCGVALTEGDDVVAVQVKGFCSVAITGAVALGYVLLAADGDGGVETVTTGGRSVLVVEVDSTAGYAVICL